jgi:beta-glucosidase
MPVQELKGFTKVFLQPGESKKIRIPLDDKAFRYWNVKTRRWEIECGEYEIRIGASSEDIRLTAKIAVEGTGAPAPYYAAELPSYYTGNVQNVPQAEFERLLGREVPADKPVIDRNMTLGQLHHSRAPIGWLIGGVLNLLLWYKKKKGTVDLNFLFVHNMPLRAIAKMTNGMVSMGVIDGLVLELKGFWVIGLCKAGYELVKNLILNARQQKRLE